MQAPSAPNSKGRDEEEAWTLACAPRVMHKLILLRQTYSRSLLKLR